MERSFARTIRSVGVAAIGIACAVAVVGCGSGKRSDKNAAAAGATGSTGGGSSTVSSPEIRLTSPSRGAFTSSGSVDVVGTVTDRAGVSKVEVQGQTVQVDAAGGFKATVRLQPGVNTLVVKADSVSGGKSESSASVLMGEWRDPAAMIEDAASARINRAAIVALERPLTGALQAANLQQEMTRHNPVYRGRATVFGICVASAEVNVTGAAFAGPQISIVPAAGFLRVTTVFDNVRLDIRARSYCGVGWSTHGTVSMSRATLVTDLVPVARRGQPLDVQIRQVDARFDGFRFDINNFPGVLESLARNMVRRKFEQGVEDMVRRNLPAAVAGRLNALFAPANVNVGTVPVLVKSGLAEAKVDDQGIGLVFDANLEAPADPRTPQNPGSCVTAGALPVHPSTSGFHLSASDDIANRALYTFWRAGGLYMELPPQAAAFLPAALPELANVLPAGARLAVRIEPKLPPMLAVTGQPTLAELTMGEMHMIIEADTGAASRMPVCTIALHVRQGIELGALQGSFLTFQMVRGQTQVAADLIAEPVIDLDDARVEAVAAQLAPVGFQLVAAQLQGMPIPTPAVPGVVLENLVVKQDGDKKDFVTISGDARAQ